MNTVRRVNPADEVDADFILSLQHRTEYEPDPLLLAERLYENPICYGYFQGQTLRGLIAYTLNDGVLDIRRLTLEPGAQHVASFLLNYVARRETSYYKITVAPDLMHSPGLPALRRFGFVPGFDLSYPAGNALAAG